MYRDWKRQSLGVPAAATSFNLISYSSTTMQTAWANPDTKASYIVVEWSLDGSTILGSATLASSTTSYQITGLTAGTLYNVRIRRVNTVGSGNTGFGATNTWDIEVQNLVTQISLDPTSSEAFGYSQFVFNAKSIGVFQKLDRCWLMSPWAADNNTADMRYDIVGLNLFTPSNLDYSPYGIGFTQSGAMMNSGYKWTSSLVSASQYDNHILIYISSCLFSYFGLREYFASAGKNSASREINFWLEEFNTITGIDCTEDSAVSSSIPQYAQTCYVLSRFAADDIFLYSYGYGVLNENTTGATASTPTETIRFGANWDGVNATQQAADFVFGTITLGKGLDTTDVANLSNLIVIFNQTVSR